VRIGASRALESEPTQPTRWELRAANDEHLGFGAKRAEPIGPPNAAYAEQTESIGNQREDRGPIIDVHLHGYPADLSFDAPLLNPATGEPSSVRDGEAHLRACLAEMRRLNIVRGIVSGGAGDRLAVAAHWVTTAPEVLIAGAGVRGSPDIPLPDLRELRRLFEDGTLGVLGEVTAQYAGLTLSDPVYDPYLALAEEMEIPVVVHTGIGPAGTSYDPCCQGFRARLGNPMLLEEALNLHPQLRVSLMHAGWPYLQDTIALMVVYPQVHADIGSLNWYFPRDEFHTYLWALKRAGLGKRIMFGSDQMYWPEAIGMAVEATESAPFLSDSDRRDIFYNNAARFYRLDDGSPG
jgi:predicted TIM-barrel fold metal-dependent hydrolase